MLWLLLACADIDPPELPEPTAGADALLVVIPSGFDDPSVWAEGMASKIGRNLAEPERWDTVVFEWSVEESDPIKAARIAADYGRWLGRELRDDERYPYTHVHLMAHRLGGHLAYEAGDVLEGRVALHETYLDPFGARSLTRTNFGVKRFGRNADFAEAYLNCDDGVPYTDEPLRHAHNFDVTALADDDYEGEDGHAWPVTFYKRTVGDLEVQIGFPLGLESGDQDLVGLSEAWPAGEVTVVDP